MTTNPGTGKPAGRSVDDAETAPLTGTVAAPDDPQLLMAEIDRTRERLGQTVQQIVARADVKSLARARAAELTGRARNTAIQARQNAAAQAASARGQVVGQTVAVASPVWEATPERVRLVVTKGASAARERWIPLAVAAGVLVVGYLTVRVGRRMRSRLSREPVS